jgi:hypothetical protein
MKRTCASRGGGGRGGSQWRSWWSALALAGKQQQRQQQRPAPCTQGAEAVCMAQQPTASTSKAARWGRHAWVGGAAAAHRHQRLLAAGGRGGAAAAAGGRRRPALCCRAAGGVAGAGRRVCRAAAGDVHVGVVAHLGVVLHVRGAHGGDLQGQARRRRGSEGGSRGLPRAARACSEAGPPVRWGALAAPRQAKRGHCTRQSQVCGRQLVAEALREAAEGGVVSTLLARSSLLHM